MRRVGLKRQIAKLVDDQQLRLGQRGELLIKPALAWCFRCASDFSWPVFCGYRPVQKVVGGLEVPGAACVTRTRDPRITKTADGVFQELAQFGAACFKL
jgi:hypothetical protein